MIRFFRAAYSPARLLFISFGAILLSCGDDESGTGGCDGSCSHGIALCKEALDSQGQDLTQLSTECGTRCRSLSQTDARSLSITLNCISQSKTCETARDCPDLGSVFGTGGLTGTGGRGTGGFGTGGYSTGGFYSTGGYVSTGGFVESGGTTGTGGSPTCLDICYLAHDGFCNDGGPGASDARCAYGTDCSDCGTRGPGSGGATGTGGVVGSGGIGSGGIGSGGIGSGGIGSGGVLGNGGNGGAGGSDGGLSSGGTLGTGGTTGTGGSIEGGTSSGGAVTSGGAPGSGGAGTGGTGTGGVTGSGGTTGTGGAGTGGSSSMLCSDTCGSSGNGVCGDSGPGSTADVCPYGTDCTDCGARTPGTNGICSNSCTQRARNGKCEDGAPPCTTGTDCADCGPR